MSPNFLSRILFAVVFLISHCAYAELPVFNAGDIPPADLGTRLDSSKVDLKDYAGKTVVVTFWATWCTYCLQELPILEKIQHAAGKERLQVVAINVEEHEVFRAAVRALKKLELLVTNDSESEAAHAFGVSGIPHMLIIGHDGKVVNVYRGYDASALKSIVADINRSIAASAQ